MPAEKFFRDQRYDATGRIFDWSIAGATGTISWTERPDLTAMTSPPIMQFGGNNAYAAPDTSAMSALTSMGAIAWIEQPDKSQMAGVAYPGPVIGQIAWTERPDTTALTGQITAVGTIAMLEQPDTSAMVGTAVGAGGVRSVSVPIVNTDGRRQPLLVNLKWAWWDVATPDLFTTPTDQGANASVNADGILEITLLNTSLPAGGTGWLTVTDSAGVAMPSPPHKAFSGPLIVS